MSVVWNSDRRALFSSSALVVERCFFESKRDIIKASYMKEALIERMFVAVQRLTSLRVSEQYAELYLCAPILVVATFETFVMCRSTHVNIRCMPREVALNFPKLQCGTLNCGTGKTASHPKREREVAPHRGCSARKVSPKNMIIIYDYDSKVCIKCKKYSKYWIEWNTTLTREKNEKTAAEGQIWTSKVDRLPTKKS